MARKKPMKKKVEIVFDTEKRKEFLTGFRKRKNERRKRAKEELDRNLKEERKRIRLEIKDGVKHMKKSYEPLRELTDQDKANENEYEDDDVKVKIVELTTNELTAQRNLLGENSGTKSEDSSEEEAEQSDDSKQLNTNCIPGMDFDVNVKRRKRTHTHLAESESAALVNKKSKSSQNEAEGPEIKSKKDLDRLKKNKTMKKLKQSKVFKLKERFDKTANQKKAKRDRNNTIKSLPKNQRKKKLEPSRYHKGRLLNRKKFRNKQQS